MELVRVKKKTIELKTLPCCHFFVLVLLQSYTLQFVIKYKKLEQKKSRTRHFMS